VRARVRSGADLAIEDGKVLVRGGLGDGPGLFGLGAEPGRPGPASLAVDSDGALFVLDQINRRIQQFDREGRLVRALPIDSEATEDIAAAGGKIWALVYSRVPRPGYSVRCYGECAGQPEVALPPSMELVTGLFVSPAGDLWVEQSHELQTLVAVAGQGVPAGARPVVPPGRVGRGRPPTTSLNRLFRGRVY
jgi:hypothetical protein